MKRISTLLLVVVAVAGIVAHMAQASGPSDGDASPIYGVKVPAGYRDWQLIAVKELHFAGKGEQLRAQLGNDIAIKAFRKGLSRSRTAPSLPRFIGLASRRKTTTKSLTSHSPVLNPSRSGLG